MSWSIQRMVTYDNDDPDEHCLAISGSICHDGFEPIFEDDGMTPRDNCNFQLYSRETDNIDTGRVSESGWSTTTDSNKSAHRTAPLRDSFEPIDDIVLKCISIEVLALVHDSWELSKSVGRQLVFDLEREAAAPSIADVEYFFAVLHSHLHLEYELALLSLIYIKRLCGTENPRSQEGAEASPSPSPIRMSPQNWRAVTIACVLLATKAWDDYHLLNREFVKPFSDILDLNMLQTIEVAVLISLDHCLWVPEMEFQNLHSVVKARFACLVRGDREESVLEAACHSDEAAVLAAAGRSDSSPAPPPRQFSKGWSWKRTKSNRIAVTEGDEGWGTDAQGGSTDHLPNKERSPGSELSSSGKVSPTSAGVRMFLGLGGGIK